jgi:hypothetical protein
MNVRSDEPATPPTALFLVDLTDEELAGIDIRPEPARLIVYPYLDDLDAHDRGQAIAVALRGLAAHGLVQAPDKATLAAALATGTVDIQMSEVLERVLRWRVAVRVVCAQRVLDGSESFCYLYLPDEASGLAGVLEESVDSAGLHQFRLHEPASAAVIGFFFNPAGYSGADGPVEQVDAATAAVGRTSPDLLDRLSRATCSGEFFLRHLDRDGERPSMLGVFSGPEGLYFSETEFGSSRPVRITPVSAGTLRDRIAAVLP